MLLEDLFGRGGSSNQGTPASDNPGDGSRGDQISTWLGRITGAYNAVVGAGAPKGPAPAAAKLTETKSNTALYIGIGVAVALVAFLLLRKR